MRTTANRATGETSFFLVYGVEAVLPPKVRLNLPRVAMFSEEEQAGRRYTDLELLKENHDIAAFLVEKYQQALWRYHSQCVRARALNIGNLVLKQDQCINDKTKLTPP